jgi:hypothetical protein
MIYEKLKLLVLILVELLISLANLPFLILNLNQTMFVSFKFKSRQQHKLDILKIAATLRAIASREPLVQVVIGRKTGEGHSSRSSVYKKGKYQIDISLLTSILEINQSDQYADVEALVTFEQLCKATLQYGLLPAVVPEFKSITIGGAIQGIAIESTSWKYGTFDKTVIEATLITGHGTILSSSEAPDLWKAVPGSNGTLALVVAARVRLVQATNWIHLRYVFYSDLSKFLNIIDEKMTSKKDTNWIGDNQVIDAIQFCEKDQSINGIVAMYGGCVSHPISDTKVYKETMFSPFFYQHVKSILTEKKMIIDDDTLILHEEYIPILEYLFRYDRGGFWMIEASATMIPLLRLILDTSFLLALLNHFFKTSTLYKIAMLVSDQKRESIGMLQDVDVPSDRTQEVINWAISKDLNKLWLCPVRSFGSNENLFSVVQSKTRFVMNIGLYGLAKNLPQSNLDLQRLVAKLQGKPGLYAHIYASRDEFWSWYNYEEYVRLRNKWDGYIFMDLWNKVASIAFSESSTDK